MSTNPFSCTCTICSQKEDSYCKIENNSTNRSNKFKQFHDSRVQQIVSLSVFFKCGNHWIKQLALDNVTIVELIL